MPTVAEMLSDPTYVVPPPGPPGPVGTLSWLRAMVCRFSEGETHSRRRALVEARLAGIDPQRLRALTAAGTSPVAALATALGVTEGVAADEAAPGARPAPGAMSAATIEAAVATVAPAPGAISAAAIEAAVATVAAAYLTGESSPEADAAVAALVAACGHGDPEVVAADIAILVQAANATAALIAGADPPVPTSRRLGPDGLVVLDLTGLPFGAGRHRCPGEVHARALAAGAVQGAGERPAG